jgi:hypothetical protein
VFRDVKHCMDESYSVEEHDKVERPEDFKLFGARREPEWAKKCWMSLVRKCSFCATIFLHRL